MTKITITVEAETDVKAYALMDDAAIAVIEGTDNITFESGSNSYSVKVERREG